MSPFEVTDDVYGIDVGLFDEGISSVYLFDDAEPTLVDAGPASGTDRLLAGLEDCGVPASELSNLVLSHVHVDHSGGASRLVEAAPDLDVYVHEATASHLVDPGALVDSSKQAMGDYFAAIGAQGPVPEANVVGVGEAGTRIDIGDATLEMVFAPGHSPDHFAVWNPDRRLLFAAECLGHYMAEADRWLPPSTLPNFDVEAVEAAIDTLADLDPETVVFPHFGVWPDEPAAAFETAERELHRFDERLLALYEETGSVEATTDAVASDLLDLSPPYDPDVEAFFAKLLTAGYLRYHDLA